MLLVLFFFLAPACLQAQLFEKGVIIDTVPLITKPDESFALYLPKSFEQQAPSAVVFVFDPVGRGKIGIKPFIEAAEAYQLIVVCSNNSRNAAYENNFKIAQRWFDDVFARFNIDSNLIYAAGFSGGSRLASTIGVLSGAFKGVIGCGASFSGNPGQVPYAKDHFYYFGLVGTLDMNYQEMLKARQWLNRISLPNEIVRFDGKHRWPDARNITSAFDWFRLQDINNKLHPKDQAFLESYITDRLANAHDAIRKQHTIEAVEDYEHILKNLNQHFELDSISTRLEQLKKSSEYKKALRERDRIASLENQWTEKLIDRFQLELDRESPPDDFRWWQKEMSRVQEDFIESEEPLLREMGIRLQNMITAFALENLEFAVLQNNRKEVSYYVLMINVNWPDNAYMQFRIARAYAAFGMDTEALVHLKQAVAKGWKDKSWILKDEVFESLAGQEEFQMILEQIR